MHPNTPKRLEKLLTEALTGTNNKRTHLFGVWLLLNVGIISQKETQSSFFGRLRQFALPYTATQVKSLKDMFKGFVKVDDRYDSLTPAEILACGPRPELCSDKPCEFIQKFLRPEEMTAFYQLEKHGAFSHEQITKHLNVVAQLMWDEANCAYTFQHTGSVEARNHMKECHIKMATYTLFTFCMILNAPYKELKGKPIFADMSEMEKAFPISDKLGKITQMYDDVFDVLRDLHEEIQLGRPSGNIVLAQVHEQSGLWQGPNQLKPEFVNTYRKYLKSEKPVALSALPEALRAGIESVRKDFMETVESTDIPTVTKIIFRSSFNSMLKEGVNPPLKAAQRKAAAKGAMAY